MKKILIMCAAILMATMQAFAGQKLDLKEITSGKFAARHISALRPLSGDIYARISKDGKRIETFSFKSSKRVGVIFDVEDTNGNKIKSFENYSMSPDGSRILIQTNTKPIYRRSFTADFYIYDTKTKYMVPLSENGPQQTPIWSPDGTKIAFVRDNNIFLVKLLYNNAESQVTKDGKFNHVINGIPDWVNEEEFGFNSAMTFNADGTMLCWIRYDESAVKEYSLQMFAGSHPENKEYIGYPGFYSYKYPKAGYDNSKVTAHSFDIKSHRTRQFELPLDADGYIPRIIGTGDPDKVIIYTMNRHQDQLNLYAANPRTTLCKLLINENVDKYVKQEAMDAIEITDKHIMLPSDRDGHMHVYLYSPTGKLVRQITKGNFDVTTIYGMNDKGDLFYQADVTAPTNREVYVTRANGKTERLTPKDGWNDAIFSKDFNYFVNMWSDCNTPYEYTVCDSRKKGRVVTNILDNKELLDKLAPYARPNIEMFKFKTADGVELYGWMMKPADFDASKKYPVIMHQYSGPGSQQVRNSWSVGSNGNGGLLDAMFTQHGYITVCVDGRGTGGRGAEFEKCTYLTLGNTEAHDQVETAIWLGKQSYIDKDRIGIWGWSFGGFCTLMSMSEGRNVFKAGVAIAPPTSWKYYDTVYTERFMRTPQENPEGYNDNPITRAANMHGALLICQGLADDNVHPQNVIEYTEALVQADIDFRQLMYTNRNHSIFGGNTRNHLFRQVINHFDRNLK